MEKKIRTRKGSWLHSILLPQGRRVMMMMRLEVLMRAHPTRSILLELVRVSVLANDAGRLDPSTVGSRLIVALKWVHFGPLK